jgi:threonine dehydrogenase-like Zn-dependent dehydrogenase
MKTRILYTEGKGSFVEGTYHKPDCGTDEIVVKAVMTGVCRSDIAMMMGEFGPLPIHMSGHEGLAKVIEVGSDITEVKVGDLVATRGEPAYADYYNVRSGEYVPVPEAHPRYILEPVACGINCVNQAFGEIDKRSDGRCLILGSGFLAWVIYNNLQNEFEDMEIDVVGRSNQELFGSALASEPEGVYDVIFDLGSGTEVFDLPILNNEALIVFGVEKTVTTNFANILWKSCTMTFPSPRNHKFIISMMEARYMIENGLLDVDKFWTRAYNRNTEWQQAFADGLDRPNGYGRGYIVWD